MDGHWQVTVFLNDREQVEEQDHEELDMRGKVEEELDMRQQVVGEEEVQVGKEKEQQLQEMSNQRINHVA